MKNLNETFEKCKSLLDDLMIDYQYDVTICVNNRFSRAIGRTSGEFIGCNSWGQPRYKFKIEINPAEPRYLKAVWGHGYMMGGEV